jgi:hypothetical protein
MKERGDRGERGKRCQRREGERKERLSEEIDRGVEGGEIEGGERG